jgi:hypothetical protein
MWEKRFGIYTGILLYKTPVETDYFKKTFMSIYGLPLYIKSYLLYPIN